MEKHFAFNYHSFVDVITNSSTELFMTTEKKVVDFFQDILNQHPEHRYSAIKILSYEQFAKEYDFEYMKREESEYFDNKYGHLNEDDMILTIKYDSDDPDFVFELAKLLNMKAIYD